MKILVTFLVAFVCSAGAYAQAPSFLGTMSESQKNFYGKNFQRCQDELISLGKLDPQSYQDSKTALEYDVNRATRYLLLRDSLSSDIQGVMDSVHQANIAKSCQKIHQKLYAALLKEAEMP